ncbi:MAG: site-specific integrase [Herminiimonas sp.]|uniref:site-specific integrase n=1 Tax=Herminiimonas sp. TaxID=1926289 RepID=UPI002726EB9B|nr:site-specific integrase [Herminiimonas sp.]MDO9419954.1 site-specific integrase [Herminiimonas sp.]
MATYTKLASGHWRAQIRKTGLKDSNTFKLRRDAVEWATARESQAKRIISSGFQSIEEGYTVGMLIDEFVRDTPAGGKTKTATLTMLKRELGNIGLRSLSNLHMMEFITKRRKTAGGVTIAADLCFLTAILKYGKHARKMDLDLNLTRDARAQLSALKVNTRSKERDRMPEDAELDLLYAHWSKSKTMKTPMETICRFALATTMRQEEICSILLSDIDPSTPSIIIRNRKDPQKKYGNDQTVPLLPAAWKIIEPIFAESKTGRVFPFEANTVSTSFTRACKATGIKNLHFHDLRHKATSDLFNKMGFQIQQVAIFTGHKDWKMLARYTHTTAKDVLNFLTQKSISVA